MVDLVCLFGLALYAQLQVCVRSVRVCHRCSWVSAVLSFVYLAPVWGVHMLGSQYLLPLWCRFLWFVVLGGLGGRLCWAVDLFGWCQCSAVGCWVFMHSSAFAVLLPELALRIASGYSNWDLHLASATLSTIFVTRATIPEASMRCRQANRATTP
jgi:hypothetical protein